MFHSPEPAPTPHESQTNQSTTAFIPPLSGWLVPKTCTPDTCATFTAWPSACCALPAPRSVAEEIAAFDDDLDNDFFAELDTLMVQSSSCCGQPTPPQPPVAPARRRIEAPLLQPVGPRPAHMQRDEPPASSEVIDISSPETQQPVRKRKTCRFTRIVDTAVDTAPGLLSPARKDEPSPPHLPTIVDPQTHATPHSSEIIGLTQGWEEDDRLPDNVTQTINQQGSSWAPQTQAYMRGHTDAWAPIITTVPPAPVPKPSHQLTPGIHQALPSADPWANPFSPSGGPSIGASASASSCLLPHTSQPNSHCRDAPSSEEPEPVINEAGELVLMPGGTVVDAALTSRLRPHQHAGVTFMHRCLFSSVMPGQVTGCILADSPGLGKSLSTIALLSALYRSQGGHLKALLVAPATMVRSWACEVRKWVSPKELPIRTLGSEGGSNSNTINILKDFSASNNYALLIGSCARSGF